MGISRFFLVLFYNNWDSSRGSINTTLTNRVGDYFLFVLFGITFFFIISLGNISLFFGLSFIYLVITSFTKRAQFPFSS